MTIDLILTIVGALIGIAGTATTAYIRIRKDKHEIMLIKKQEQEEKELRLKAEKEKFYLTIAPNLVASAERLTITGPQKKEYVMTWLENEAIKAGVEVDRALMSVSVERTITLMNDHRHKDKNVSEIIAEDFEKSLQKEKDRINEDAQKQYDKIINDANRSKDRLDSMSNISNETLDKIKDSLNK